MLYLSTHADTLPKEVHGNVTILDSILSLQIIVYAIVDRSALYA